MISKDIIKIDKLHVSSQSFCPTEILQNPADRSIRQYELSRALTLGNLYKHSVTNCFVSAKGEQLETEATVWAVTEKYVQLKGGNYIPIRAITQVVI
jgi:hypothetical protein